MANEEHLRILRQGVEVWNQWRAENPQIRPDLYRADLEYDDLNSVNLTGANLYQAKLYMAILDRACLYGADLNWADLGEATLKMADLRKANFGDADLREADLERADLKAANLSGADFYAANLMGADLSEAYLVESRFVETKIEGARLTGSRVYGISAWRLEGVPEDQSNLIITRDDEPVITVDNLEVAQFIYLLLHSPKIRDAIDTIAKKAVLILGRFTEERKIVLDAIRDELRKHDYLPILFDWDKPAGRNLVETVSTLAHLSRFVIADITDAKSIPAELMCIVPVLPSVAVQPLMLSSDYEYALFDHIKSFKSVLPVYLYDTPEMLLANLKEHVIDPAETKARELIPPAANR